MVGEEGDFSLLREIVNHEKMPNCETCKKHSPKTMSCEILSQISISNSSKTQNDAPYLLRIDLTGELLQQLPEMMGEYVRQDQLINKDVF